MRQSVLIYNFDDSEVKEWSLAVKQVPGVILRAVKKNDFPSSIEAVLDGKSDNSGPVNAEVFKDKMIVFENIDDKLLEYMLAVSKMITNDHVYKAVVTETNIKWSSSKLIYNLREEDEQIRKMNS